MRLSLIAGCALLAACSPGGGNTKQQADMTTGAAVQGKPFSFPASATAPFTVTRYGSFDNPFSLTFLPDGSALVTEKPGALKWWHPDGSVADVAGVPKVAYGGQGGLLDIALAPDFATSRTVYLTYAEPRPNGRSLALAKATLPQGGKPVLSDLNVIWRASSDGDGGQFGGVIAFAPEGRTLFLSTGERMRKTPAQDPDQAIGKIIHLTLDGKPAPDNPMVAQGGKRADIWTLGHRNPYGLAFDKAGNLWEIEMGPKGGDELNLILKGKNYGWPVVSNGDNYDGSPIPDHDTHPQFEAPKLWWNPSISPAGLVIYSGRDFPQWDGSALMGALSGQALVRVALNGTQAAKADRWDMGARIRDVAQAPDGSIWLLQDGDDAGMLKLTPKQKP